MLGFMGCVVLRKQGKRQVQNSRYNMLHLYQMLGGRGMGYMDMCLCSYKHGIIIQRYTKKVTVIDFREEN